jgi:hypothetical protein
MIAPEVRIGRVTRSSTRDFIGALRIPEPDLPTFGSFCMVEAQSGRTQVIGLIYDIRIQDDEFTRQLAIQDELNEEQIADNRENRLVPVEISALTIGYYSENTYHYTLPPQPPITLSDIYSLEAESIHAFSAQLDFISPILTNNVCPADELVIAAVQQAIVVRAEPERKPYLIEAGKLYTRYMYKDLARVEATLSRFELALPAAEQTR